MGHALTLVQAAADAGKVSDRNGKMPGTTFAIDATKCLTGSKLVKVEGSVCHKCYALRLQKYRASVDQGWQANYLRATQMIQTDPAKWARAAAYQIERGLAKLGEDRHRWFDGGDLQSLEMLHAIVLTCRLTPKVRHWLSTREARIVQQYKKLYGKFPRNLVVRVSATMVDDGPVTSHTNTSTVYRSETNTRALPKGTHKCPAHLQGNKCLKCDACWRHAVRNVGYPFH